MRCSNSSAIGRQVSRNELRGVSRRSCPGSSLGLPDEPAARMIAGIARSGGGHRVFLCRNRRRPRTYRSAAGCWNLPRRWSPAITTATATPPSPFCIRWRRIIRRLLKFDAANYPQIVGDLAQSWEVSPDRQTYTFKLRPNVLFHDGSRLTSADIKASYQRIMHPPQGVTSSRQVDFGAIAAIDTPDPLTVVFRLQWPDAAMLANFASPWNCIYSAAKLAEDPQFPKTHILGTGPFVFVEHKKGESWRAGAGRSIFSPASLISTATRPISCRRPAIMKAYESGRIMAEFRGVTPTQRDQLAEKLGDRIATTESPWLSNLLVVFNTQQEAVRRCARAARAVSGDRPLGRGRAAAGLDLSQICRRADAARRESGDVGSRAASLPGFSRDIAAARAEAKRLLAEAGVDRALADAAGARHPDPALRRRRSVGCRAGRRSASP